MTPPMPPTYIVIAGGFLQETPVGQSYTRALNDIWTGDCNIGNHDTDVRVFRLPDGADVTDSAARALADRSIEEGETPAHLAAWIDDVGYDQYRAPTANERATLDEERAAARRRTAA